MAAPVQSASRQFIDYAESGTNLTVDVSLCRMRSGTDNLDQVAQFEFDFILTDDGAGDYLAQ